MILWIIGWLFFIGYTDMQPETFKETAVAALTFFLWPWLLGAQIGGHLDMNKGKSE